MTPHASARDRLREETGDLHATLDGLLSAADFNDRASYASFLARQAAPLFAVETAIADTGLGPALPDWPARRRSDAIRHDLAALDAAVPEPAAFSRLPDRDAALGALYVLEGSRLGAKFLVRSARDSRDPRVRAATAYLGHGEGEAFWPRFLKSLAARETDGLDEASLIAGACAAFEAFIASARIMPIRPAA